MKCYCVSVFITFNIVTILGKVVGTLGGGRLFYPPGRSSLWRFNYTNVPINENDNNINCGGFKTHWILNEGKCGLCGDAWTGPRDHEFGGKYDSGIISETYIQNSIINVSVEILENLNGWFEFKLCRFENKSNIYNCIVNYTLQIGDTGRTRYRVRQKGFHVLPLKLPGSLECKHCLLRWKYHTGTRWGCDKKKCCKGCGPKQEEFYSCADIAIKRSSSVRKNTSRRGPCDISVYQRWWCRTQCIGHECYSGFCACLQKLKSRIKRTAGTNCQSIGVWTSPGMTTWCNNNCNNEIPYCPSNMCSCTEDASTTTVTTASTQTSTKTSSPVSSTTTTTTTTATSTPTTTVATSSSTIKTTTTISGITTTNSGATQPYPVSAPGMVKLMVTAGCKYCSDKNNVTCRNLYCPGYDIKSTGVSGSNIEQRIIRLAEHFCETCDVEETLCRKLFCQNSDGPPVMKDLGIAIKCSMCVDLGDQTCLQDPSCLSNMKANTENPSTSGSSAPPVGMLCTPKEDYREINGIKEWCDNNRDERACDCIGTLALNGQVPYEPGYICRGAGAYATNVNMGNWCVLNCALNNCPSTHCYCYPPPTTKQTTQTTTTTASTTTPTTTGTDSYSLNLLNGLICDMSQSDQNTFRSTIFRYCPVYDKDMKDPTYNTDRTVQFTADLLHQFSISQKPDLSSYTFGGIQSNLASKINQGFCGSCTGLGIQNCTQYCDS